MTAAARKAFDEAVALEESGDLDKALVSYLKAQELSPQDTEIAYRTASALLQAGYLEEAQSQLRRIVFAEPEHMNARASLGNCQLLLNDLSNAKQNFLEVLDQKPENRNALFGLASILLKEGKAGEATEPAKRLVDLLPETPSVLTLFAETQAKSGQIAPAIAAFRKALKTDQAYVPALLGLSEILLQRKRFDEVVELTIRACNLSPADSKPLELLSDALAGKGALEDAQEAAEEALKLNPRSLPVLVHLSVLSRKRGDQTSALKYALAAHDQNISAQEPLNALGAALASLKHTKQARSVLTGLAEGKKLDTEVRQLVESLIETDNARKGADVSTFEQSPYELGNEPATLDGAAAEKAAGQAAKSQDPSMDTAKRGSKMLAPDKDEIPNVLGLTRQDRS